MTIQLKGGQYCWCFRLPEKLYHNEYIYFPFRGTNTAISTIQYTDLVAKFKENLIQGMYLCKQHLGFYTCPSLHNSSFFIYKWNQMIWDHDDLRYIYSMNYSEKEGLRKK